MKALVVDSSQTMRSVLGRILSMRGLEVAEAENCKDALNLVRNTGEPDLVLVDWDLPNNDSLELVTCLRRELASETKVILLASTEPSRRDLHRALIAGADAYLMKPFTSLEIDQELNRAGFAWRG